jgi:hypothetical protein
MEAFEASRIGLLTEAFRERRLQCPNEEPEHAVKEVCRKYNIINREEINRFQTILSAIRAVEITTTWANRGQSHWMDGRDNY